MFEILVIGLITLTIVYWRIATKRPLLYPPGPKWLPIVGNTSLLRKAIKEHGNQMKVFEAWKEKYNSPVIGLKLGSELVVVAMTYPIIHEVHINDAFDGRPDNFFIRMRTMGSRLGVTVTDGEFWTEQRNFVQRHLRRSGYGRQAMEEQIQFESNELIDMLSEFNEKPVWAGPIIATCVLNVLWSFTADTKISRTNTQLSHLLVLLKKRNEAFDVTGGWLTTFPWLRFIAPEMTAYNLIQKFNAELQNFFTPIIEEHKLGFSEDKVDDDLIYAFINEMKRAEGTETNFTDTQLVMIILDLFMGGSQTSSDTMGFVLMALVLNQDVQKKCQQEIDQVLGSSQVPSLADRSKLAYVEAVIFEVQRFYNIVPISGPRRVMRDTILGGYAIPKNTTVLMGLEGITMDPEYWNDPHVFRPERFLDGNGKIINHERFVVYGQGRRRCLGEALARAVLFIFTVGILQKFNLEDPLNGKGPKNEIQYGILSQPKPYEMIFKHRSRKVRG